MKYKLALLSMLLILACVSICFAKPLNRQEEDLNFNTSQIATSTLIVEQESVSDMIIRLTVDSDVSTSTALRIADCESKMGTQMENPSSSAKGVYQFISKTWQHYCSGDVMNNEDNIKCFLKLYPDHKNWWECS